MSWSTSVQIPKDTNYREAEKMILGMTQQGQATPEAEAALTEAKHSAIALMASGCFTGKQDGEFTEKPLKHGISVSLSGHANPGHEPKTNWANDCVNISVAQMSDPKEP